MKVICDTNVWYNIESGLISKPRDDLILTMATLFDFFASPKINKDNEKHENLVGAYKYARENCSDILKFDPLDYPGFILRGYMPNDKTNRSIELMITTLDEIVGGHYDDDKIKFISNKCVAAKGNFSQAIVKNNSHIKNQCSYTINSKRDGKYKLKKKCVREMIRTWLGSLESLSDNELNKEDLDKMVFVEIYYHYLNNKPKTVDDNSMVDLSFFLYLTGNDYKFWTEENQILDIIRQAFGNTIPDFIYPHGVTVKKIFC